MSTKETTITTETAADGTEMVSEISSVISETAADGTETVAEITTTAGDEPGEVEGHITLTETAPDGTETVTEITTNADGSVIVEEDKSLTEEVYEAVFGEEAEDYEIVSLLRGSRVVTSIVVDDLHSRVVVRVLRVKRFADVDDDRVDLDHVHLLDTIAERGRHFVSRTATDDENRVRPDDLVRTFVGVTGALDH